MGKITSIFIFVFLLLFVFFFLLYFYPIITFFILLSFSTVYIVGNFLDRIFPKKFKSISAGVFSFFLYLLIAMFIFTLSALIYKLNSLKPDFENLINTNKYAFHVYKHFKEYLDFVAITKTLAEIATYGIIYPVLTFFLLKERFLLKREFLSIIPNKYFEMMLNILYHVNIKLKAWFKGLFIQTLIYSFICALGSLLVIPKFAIVLGFLGGFANIIPFFGTIFNYVFFALIFYLFLKTEGLIIGIATVSVAQFVDMIVYPYTYGKVLSIPSSLVIISVLLGGKFLGIIGMLVAVPMTTIIYAVVVEFGRTVKYYRGDGT